MKELPFEELLTFKECLEEFCLFLCYELSSADLNPDRLHFTNTAVLSSAWLALAFYPWEMWPTPKTGGSTQKRTML